MIKSSLMKKEAKMGLVESRYSNNNRFYRYVYFKYRFIPIQLIFFKVVTIYFSFVKKCIFFYDNF